MIITFFAVFDRENYLSLISSLIGVFSLIFSAKGNPVGQVLMIVFSVLYGIISFGFRYYGEMITYVGMTLPMAIFALVSWLKNPYEANKSEVKIRNLKKNEALIMVLLTIAVTLIFYFILKHFNTATLIPSTISVATSFLAAYLTFMRSIYFTLAYAANDVVLIILWVLASLRDISYISVVICFIVFLVNDLYGFCNWRKMKIRQESRGNI